MSNRPGHDRAARGSRRGSAVTERGTGSSAKLRVLQVGKFYPPVSGGMETVLQNLCEWTAERWDVTVVVAHERLATTAERRGALRVIRAGSFGVIASVSLCPTMPTQMWRGRYDCVVLHEPNPLAGTSLFLRCPADHLVIWHHSDIVRPAWAPHVYGPIQQRLYRRADCVIFSSPRLADHSVGGSYAFRRAVIPFGIDLAPFERLNVQQEALATTIRGAHVGPRVLFVGRLVYYKGLDVLLHAMTRCPGTLLIVGDGPERDALRALVQTLGLAARVRFLTRVSAEELPAYYHAADLFVLPSTKSTEAFGLVQIEAMAAGLPVVSTDLATGVPWVNQDGVTGLVVRPGDSDRLAAAIGHLLHDPGLRSAMGAAARRRAAERFSRDCMVAEFVTLVESLVETVDGIYPKGSLKEQGLSAT